MSSKVTAKLRLGAAFSVLLISLTLLAGCKQDADNSYTPPGYGASVGPLTDTVWKNGSDTIRFGAEGKVVDVPKKWNVLSVRIQISDRVYQAVQAEFNDFTYSGTNIYGKVTKVGEEWVDYLEVGDRVKVATFIFPTTTTNQDGQNITVTNYYKMGVTIEDENTPSFFTMDNKPTSGDKFVGTYYDEQGRKEIQINKDGTFVTFTNGGQSIQYWKDKNDGTISVAEKPFDSSNSNQTSSTYYLYPHALMKYNGYSGSAEAWK